MLHNVHIYAVVRVRLDGIEAPDHPAAVLAALKQFDADPPPFSRLGENVEYAEEVAGALVDEQGDYEYEKTTYHKPTGEQIPAT